MKLPDINDRIKDILDHVVQAADTKAAREIDYYNTKSPMDRDTMVKAQEAYDKAYENAVTRLNRLVWTGGQFIEDLHKGKG